MGSEMCIRDSAPTIAAPWSALILTSIALALGTGACIQDAEYDDGGGGAGVGGSGTGAGPTPDPIAFDVMTWNVRNLFNDQNDSSAPQEEIDSDWPARRAEVGNVLFALDTDVVVLQEVEHTEVLEELDTLELMDRYPHISVSEGNDPRGIDVGVMSKYPFDQVVSHAGEVFTQNGSTSPNYKFARDAYEVHMTVNQRHVVLIGVHFKAKDNDDPDKRLAEAQRTRNIANAVAMDDPDAAIIVLGDFNDLPQSPPYEAVALPDPSYRNAALLAPVADQYTYTFNGTQELVDHVMMNPVADARVDAGTVRIVHGPEAQDASDHSPVIVGFMMN